MEMIKIENSKLQLLPNFNMSEFYKPLFGCQGAFVTALCLPLGCQVFRDYYKKPIVVTSMLRKSDTFGYHRFGWAVDIVCPSMGVSFILDVLKEVKMYNSGISSILIENLRKVGVEGIGIEVNNCIHLDWRNKTNVNKSDKYGKYITFTWVADGSLYGRSVVI